MIPSPKRAATGILVACRDADEYPALLESLAEQGATLDYAQTAEEALQAYDKQEILLAEPDIAAATIDQMPGVRWVQSTWAGISPLLHTRRQDFILTGIKDAFGPQMVEYVLGHILAHELQLVQRLQKQRAGLWWPESTGRMTGKTLGIMGLGSIGLHIAHVAAGFGVKLVGLSRSGSVQPEFEHVFTVTRLHEFLALADYIVAVLPETPETTGLMDTDAFAAMKPTALFINVGRGNLVDEDDLVAALQQHQLAGAVLDVFRTEPLPETSPLWTAPNLTITAHVAARSWPEDVSRIFLDNFRRSQRQHELNYVIDRQRGY